MDPKSLTDRLAKLSPAKRALLERRLKEKGLEPLAGRTIPLRESQEFAPLSFAQQRLWFLNQLEPESPAYNEPRAVRLMGALDIEALEKSLNSVIERHEVLRTNIVMVDGNPMQRVMAHRTVEMPLIDLRAAQDRDVEACRLINEMIRRPFDLSHDLMLRVLLLRLEDQKHALALVQHHVASDGWSSGIFWQEVTAFYEAYTCGRLLKLPELPVQYADYAVWQREWFRGEILETQLSYWRKQLDNLTTLALPTDRPRPVMQSFRGAKQTLVLPNDLSEALKGLSRTEGLTLFMTLLAAFQTLLYRYTGQEDIAVGSPIAGRNRVEIEKLIGFFVNTLVLRTDVSGSLTFRELLRRVRGVCLDAYSQQDLPFEKLVEELQPHRHLNHNPLFQVTFQLNNGLRSFLKLPAVEVEDMELESGISKFDLSLFMSDLGESITGRLQYNTDLFDEATIARMLDHFRTLLGGIVTDPDQRLSELPILTEAERRQLMVEWNAPQRDAPRDKCLHHFFEEQVDQTPEAVAVIYKDQELTFRELNRRANRLAHRLCELGVGPDILVGLCVERSIELVIGILGILKAGGAYVPFDPSYPEDRLEFMLKDSDVSVLLTQRHLSENLPSHDSAVVYLDAESLNSYSADPSNEVNFESGATPDNLAYVIYTSGSTGKPKGALITHNNVVRLFRSTKRWFEFNSSDVWTLFHSYAFDFSVWEMWGALLNGGRLVVVPYSVSRSPDEFAALIEENRVTVLNQTPSAFRQLMSHLISIVKSEPSALRYVIFGGEALELQSLQPWFDRYGDQTPKLINMYGITETAVHVTYRPIAQADLKSRVTSVIGKPIPDLRVYVLDPSQRLQPIGIPGEIYVGGAGVAKGYLKRPQLTAERFIPDPFFDDPQARLYKSGDLARWLPDGELEYLGRIDDQIKIRGYRIELGEIEALLNQHMQVREAVVVAREDTPGDKRLVAYVAADDQLATEELRSRLGAVLPDYMVPSAIVRLKTLPLTSNGKIDRAALPPPDQSRPKIGQSYVAPGTEIEVRLCEIFGAVLRIDRVGIHDNFFELGGHSLLATQVVARMRSVLHEETPVRRLFETPTVYGLAKNLERERHAVNHSPIQRAIHAGPPPLSFAQERLWFIDQLEPHSSAYNVPGAWRLTGLLDIAALQRSIDEIIRRHEILRTSLVNLDGRPVQRILPSITLSLEPLDLTGLSESERESAAQSRVNEEFQRSFDLAHGPLLRAKLLKLTNDDHILLLTMHHIVADGWSLGVLFRELSLLYQAFAADKPSPLEDLPIQYADYAIWQRHWLEGNVLDAQLAYWKKQLDNLTVLQLPTDRPRPALQSYRGAKVGVHLDALLTEKLRALSRGENATIFILLLAAFQTLLSRISGQGDIAVGSPIAGRSRHEIEGLIGFFANTLVLRGDLSDNPTFRQFLARVREMALEAYAHQDLPFEKLVEELRPERSLNNSPLFQVMLVLQNDPREDLTLTGITVNPVSFDRQTAKFDLLLSLRERKAGLVGTLEYNTDLFDSTTVERMIEQFKTLLGGIVSNPDQRVGQLPLLTKADQQQFFIEWNDTTKAYPKHLCVHQLFEMQADKSPDQIAVVFEDWQMTYRELDQRANQLAHYLRKHEVGPESLVGIYLERSLDMIVSLLAVLKAGGAYVPLDPSYPAERIRVMLEQTATSVILTQTVLASRLPQGSARAHCLDSLAKFIAQEKCERLSSTCLAENAAYALFTSGSTGVPKGVLMEHRSLVNLLSWQAENSVRKGSLNTLQFASLTFDVSFQEIFSTLASGGTLVMIAELTRRDPFALLQMLREKAVERLFLPFVYFQQLAEAAETEGFAPKTLLEIITAGEQLQVTRPIAKLFDRLPHCRLYNHYGPTESHVVTSFSLSSKRKDWPSLPPVGRPIANARIYILDEFLQPVSIGVTGELYITGDCLSRGYINRPDLTAEKFIPNPFAAEPGARMYKTGDLARYLSDGNIEFLGRIDNQVKIRGFRIEPGEIEAALNQCAGVRESVAIARRDVSGEKRLLAYVVANTSAQLSSQQLRIFLGDRLPEYMIPAAFQFLDTMPLTPNGKLDRKALPAPDSDRREDHAGYVAPRTAVEKVLAEIWGDILRVERVGIHDNFFHIGGHSLLAVQVVSRIHRILQTEISLRCLFESPTIASFAEKMEIATDLKNTAPMTSIERVSEKTNIPLSFAQERLWILDQMESGNPAFNMNGSFRLTGPLNQQALERSLNEILRRHDSLRTTFQLVDGNPVQIISPSQTIRMQVIDLQSLPTNERETQAQRMATEDGKCAFDLKEGPLFRAQLIRLSPWDHVLGIRMHHIVSDGWSLGVFYRELSALYEAFASGQPSPLPALPIQYAAYAIWQREWLRGDVLDAQLAYWRKQLTGVPAFMELPTDRPRPAFQTYQGMRESLVVSDELRARLKVLGSSEGVTLFIILLTAFQTQLHRYTGQDDVVVGSPVAGRNSSETEGLIGFFLNNLVLRTSLSGNPTFRELLARVREVALSAYEHQDLPFEKLLEELQPERDRSRTPLFQVYLNMLSMDELRLKLEGLTIEALRSPEPESKFDLTLYVKDRKEELRFDLVYNADLFEKSRIREMLEQLEYLLFQVVDNPDQCINLYSLVTPKIKRLLPNPTEKLDDKWKGAVHEKFAFHARTNPQQLAIIDRWSQWTYEELNSRSNQLAHFLLAHGIRPGSVIAIRGHRSASLVCAVLGVLKAGATFLILDPAYPAERLIECLRQANPHGWLNIKAAGPLGGKLRNFVNSLSTDCQLELSTTVATLCDRLNDYPTDDPGIPTGADNLAYVSFTSGSMGQPKGVLGKHGPLSHFLPWQERTFGLSAADRFTMFSGLSHDPLQRDMFTSLWVGATICIPDPDFMATTKLIRWMTDLKVTFSHLTPPTLQFLTEAHGEDLIIPTLRYAFFVGDKLTPRDVRRIRHVAPNVSCISSYGTTETQRAVGYFTVPKEFDVGASSNTAVYPVGRGIEDVQVLVLNSERGLAGISELGEIYLRSPHLALGYLGDDALTQSRFLINPFSRTTGDRLYRTGDLGRYLPDGNIEFVGRIDEQVKIRGYRVEPGEIESMLSRHSGIRECVVVARQDDVGDKWLVAYIVAAKDSRLTANDLRAFLKDKLPEYMIPTAFGFLPLLPLTPNGKLDRRALPEPDSNQGDHAGYVAPRTAVEQVLAELWAEILKVERVGVRDNFFDLGGYSLMGIRLIDQVCKELQIELPLRRLFECPTVAELAKSLDVDLSRAATDRRANSPWRYLFELKPGQGKQPVFFLPGGFGGDYEFLVYARLTHFVGDHFSFYGLRARSADGTEDAHQNVEQMAGDYLKEIRELQPEGPYFIVGNCIGGIVAYEIAQQLKAQGQDLALLVLMDTRCPTPQGYSRYRKNLLRDRLNERLTYAIACWRDNYYLARLIFHWQQLREMGWRERLPYVLRKTEVATKAAAHIISKPSALTNEPSTVSEMKRRQIQEGYIDALHRYRPRPYFGRAVMLVNEKAYNGDPTLGWSELIAGGIEIQKIPGDHEAYIRQYVQTAADVLRDCLKSASLSKPKRQARIEDPEPLTTIVT